VGQLSQLGAWSSWASRPAINTAQSNSASTQAKLRRGGRKERDKTQQQQKVLRRKCYFYSDFKTDKTKQNFLNGILACYGKNIFNSATQPSLMGWLEMGRRSP